MKQYLWAKVIAGLLALGALLYGVSIMDSDPQLRVMEEVNIADIEAGQMPREGQRVRILEVWLLPTWVVEYSHSRKRGDHAHVHVAIGSKATLDRAAAGQPVEAKLWMRLPEDFRTREAATAAMNRNDLYAKPQDRDGVINELPASVREQMGGGGPVTSTATMRLQEGAVPSSQGEGLGWAAAGLLALALVAAWVATDWFNDRWRQGLATEGFLAFQGASRWLLLFGAVLLAAPVLLFLDASVWVDAQQLDTGLLVTLVLLLAAAGWALWRHRMAYIVGPKGLERADRSGRTPLVRWDHVQALSVAQRHFRGSVAVTYTLHTDKRKFSVGNSLLKGGVEAHAALGQALGERVNGRIATALLERLAAGARVAFGALGACRTGLIKGKLDTGEVLPWGEIESTKLAEGKLRIKRKGKLLAWETVALGKLHNPDLLLHLIEQGGVPPAATA
ncbi:hypothetical protein DBR42_03540 [Pelomonas sp. HMWF004]|nr:hypothetical protein DBR42_03540 [Pelomonas sp. HMWF004]